MTTTYYVARDTARRATDEDRAMAHDDIYRGSSLDDAKESLRKYMESEVEWLRKGAESFKIATGQDSASINRANEIEESLAKIDSLEPENNKVVSFESAGLLWSIMKRES